LNHTYGDKSKKPDEEHALLEDELADVLYTIICLANKHNIELAFPLEKAIAKHESRDKDCFARKIGF
jgi:NTP pyrophosphatase (non-canonical NTP hydrolase)